MKELEDFQWFPSFLRNYQTDYIGFVTNLMGTYRPFISYIKSKSKLNRNLTDLCSGSGAPALALFGNAGHFKSIMLTDKYPNESIRVPYATSDVTTRGFTKDCCYTMFNAFHHFSDEEKTDLVNKLRQAGTHAWIVEIIQPTVYSLLKVLVTSTIGCLLLTPFVRPFSWKRLLFTYVLPVNLFTITYDGIISVYKSRTLKDYQMLLDHTGAKVFRLGNCIIPLVVIEINPYESDQRILDVHETAHDYREYNQYSIPVHHSVPEPDGSPALAVAGADHGHCE